MRDKQSITIACIYRFLMKGKINKEMAIQLMRERAGIRFPENTVTIWCRNLDQQATTSRHSGQHWRKGDYLIMDTSKLSQGCRRILPANNLDQVDAYKFQKNTSCLSWRRDKEKCDEEKVYPVKLIPLSQYQPRHNPMGKAYDFCQSTGNSAFS